MVRKLSEDGSRSHQVGMITPFYYYEMQQVGEFRHYQLSVQQPPNTIITDLPGPYVSCLALLGPNPPRRAPPCPTPHLTLVHMN